MVWNLIFLQAKLPDYQHISNYKVDEDSARDLEDPRWSPGIIHHGDLMMYLRAARSMAAFQGLFIFKFYFFSSFKKKILNTKKTYFFFHKI